MGRVWTGVPFGLPDARYRAFVAYRRTYGDAALYLACGSVKVPSGLKWQLQVQKQ